MIHSIFQGQLKLIDHLVDLVFLDNEWRAEGKRVSRNRAD